MWRIFKFLGYKIEAKVFEEGSVHGLKELPRISKLSVTKGKEWLLNYDRGWDFNELHPVVFKAIVKFLEAII